MTNLTSKSPQLYTKKQFDINKVACLFLYMYLMFSTLVIIPWIPNVLNTYSLYGFVVIGLTEFLLFKRSFALRTHTIWYFLFCLICLCSSFYSANMDISLATTLEMVKILVFSFVAANTLNSQKKINTCIGIYSISCTILYAYLATTGQLIASTEERLGETLVGNANAFANTFMVAALFSIYFIFFAKNKFAKICFFAMFCMQLHALALSGSRKNFILPIILLCLMKLISTDKRGRKHLIKNTIIVTLILFIAFYSIFNVEFLYNSIGYRMEGLVSLATGEGTIDYSSEIRTGMVEEALRLWQNRLFFGNGIDTFKKISSYNTYSHNNYAELLCDIGIFGFSFYYIFYAIGIFKLLNQRNRGDYRWYWLFSLISLLAFDLGAITYNMFIVQFLLLICIMDPDKNKQSERNI